MNCLCSLPLRFMPQPCGLSIFGLHSFVFKSIPKAIVVIEPIILESVQGTKVRLKMQALDLLALLPLLSITQL